MLTTCSEPGCVTLVLGGRCIEHEQVPTRVFVRGRPLVAARRRTAGAAHGGFETLARSGVARTLDARSDAPLGLERSRN
jgi:hypothetical protein